MKLPLSFRAQEWLADRFSFVQYPNISAADSRTKDASRMPFFKHAMPLGKRIDLFFMSIFLLVLGLAVIAFFILIIYLFIF